MCLEGLLLVAILGGGDVVNTFSVNDTFSRTKTYMTVILAFVAITSIIVNSFIAFGCIPMLTCVSQRFTGSLMYLTARVFYRIASWTYTHLLSVVSIVLFSLCPLLGSSHGPCVVYRIVFR